MQKSELTDCHKRIAPYIHRTPVLTSSMLNKLAGCELYFKCENFQKIGAFKMRGATNAVLQLNDEQKKKGVVTHSSGNFAQAVALAAHNAGIKSYIVMPGNASSVKKEAVKGYFGEIIETDDAPLAREIVAEQVRTKTGATFLHPSDNLEVIIGQSTACMELLEDHPEIEAVFTPVGGGGLIAGTALAAHFFGNRCKVYGGEPFEADDAYRSFKSRDLKSNRTANTIADGLRSQLGDINFPIILEYVSDIFRVTEDEIISAMKLIWERMKIIVEPSSAVAFAALLDQKEKFKDKKVGIILSGGNIDLKNLPFNISTKTSVLE